MRPQIVMKLGLFSVLRHLPGASGEKFDTRYYWARRAATGPSTQAAFERVLAGLGPESVCIDLGANLGDTVSRLLTRAGHVHAFEPEPWTFSRLKSKFEGDPRVTLHNAAAGAKDGALRMMRDPAFRSDPDGASQGTSAFRSLIWEKGSPDAFEAPVVDFCRFLRELDRPVDILKIDIEGGEVELLEALLDAPERKRVRYAFVETHEAQIPELRTRTEKLRARARSMAEPKIYLDWK